MDNEQGQSKISRTVSRLLLMAVAMFAFGFALVPLYDVFCEITGINGKSFNVAADGYQAVPAAVDTSREIKVIFIANNNDGMSWEFAPSQTVMRVHPGAKVDTVFYAKNPMSYQMIGQAVPSVQPIRAAEYFHKTECFCFNQQVLEGEQAVEMPLQFIVDQDLPQSVRTITLSYTLFDVTEHGPQQRVAAN
jgi:cytochrome c oxidase assembly protein subunit 11